MGMQLQVPVNMSRWCGITTTIPVLGVLNRLIIARLSSPKENSREVCIYGGVLNEFETLDEQKYLGFRLISNHLFLVKL